MMMFSDSGACLSEDSIAEGRLTLAIILMVMIPSDRASAESFATERELHSYCGFCMKAFVAATCAFEGFVEVFFPVPLGAG